MSETHNTDYFSILADKATNILNNIILVIVYQTVSEYLEIKEMSAELHRIKNLKV